MFLSSVLDQNAVYWSPSSINGSGQRSFGIAVELDCRWEDKQILFIDTNGNEVRSEAVVYLSSVVELGGYLYQGTEDDLDSEHSDPYDVSGAREIRGIKKSHELNGTDYLVKVFL